MVKLQDNLIIKFRTEEEWNRILKLLNNSGNSNYNYQRFRNSYKDGDLQILTRNRQINGFGTSKTYINDSSYENFQFIDIKQINKIIEIW